MLWLLCKLVEYEGFMMATHVDVVLSNAMLYFWVSDFVLIYDTLLEWKDSLTFGCRED